MEPGAKRTCQGGKPIQKCTRDPERGRDALQEDVVIDPIEGHTDVEDGQKGHLVFFDGAVAIGEQTEQRTLRRVTPAKS